VPDRREAASQLTRHPKVPQRTCTKRTGDSVLSRAQGAWHSVDMQTEKPLYQALKSRPVSIALLLAAVSVSSAAAFGIAGPAGMGVLGLSIAFVAQWIKVEFQGGAASGGTSANLHAMLLRAEEQMSHADRAASKQDIAAVLAPTGLATTIGVAMTVVGFAAALLG
jgi:hypothetical protein